MTVFASDPSISGFTVMHWKVKVKLNPGFGPKVEVFHGCQGRVEHKAKLMEWRRFPPSDAPDSH